MVRYAPATDLLMTYTKSRLSKQGFIITLPQNKLRIRALTCTNGIKKMHTFLVREHRHTHQDNYKSQHRCVINDNDQYTLIIEVMPSKYIVKPTGTGRLTNKHGQ